MAKFDALIDLIRQYKGTGVDPFGSTSGNLVGGGGHPTPSSNITRSPYDQPLTPLGRPYPQGMDVDAYAPQPNRNGLLDPHEGPYDGPLSLEERMGGNEMPAGGFDLERLMRNMVTHSR